MMLLSSYPYHRYYLAAKRIETKFSIGLEKIYPIKGLV